MKIAITFLALLLNVQVITAQISFPSKKWGIGYGYHDNRFSGILFHSVTKKDNRSMICGLNISLISGSADVRGFSYASFKNLFTGDGICISGVLLNGHFCRGLLLTGIKTDIYSITGITISPVNKVEKLRGVTIGLVNITHRKRDIGRYWFEFPSTNKGLQIGIFNHQKTFRGVQIGLININKSNSKLFRILPFINMNLRKFNTH